MDETRHISEVCKELNTTSRTIRYYEQLGLISTVRGSRNAPRRLDEQNTAQLRKILFLRKIGLSLDEIQDIVKNGLDVAELLRTKSAEFKAEIAALHSRIRLLEKVTSTAEKGGDIYAVALDASPAQEDAEHCRIAAECIRLLLEHRFSEIPAFVAPKLRPAFSEELLSISWHEFTEPCGAFIETGAQTVEGYLVKNHLYFEKMGAVITIAFGEDGIKGIMSNYLKEKENPHVSSKRTGTN